MKKVIIPLVCFAAGTAFGLWGIQRQPEESAGKGVGSKAPRVVAPEALDGREAKVAAASGASDVAVIPAFDGTGERESTIWVEFGQPRQKNPLCVRTTLIIVRHRRRVQLASQSPQRLSIEPADLLVRRHRRAHLPS